MSTSSFYLLTAVLCAAVPVQPPVQPGVNEPGLVDILARVWGLELERDLRNPIQQGPGAGLFIKADPNKPVVFRQVIALGMENPTHAGWYPAGPNPGDVPGDPAKARVELWSYAFKQPEGEMNSYTFTAPPLSKGEPAFDPGLGPFGLWVSNEAFDDDGGVYTQPAAVAKANARLRAQPYKAMIYPTRDRKFGKLVPDSYIIAWEYSTNDDFQDILTRIDNVRLLNEPSLGGIVSEGVAVRKLADGFQFTEGPAWDARNGILYFSDIPRKQIIAFSDDRARVVKTYDGQTNGLMFDAAGSLYGCENAGRRVSRDLLGDAPRPVASTYNDRKLNSPNDLWFDAEGGIYFTDPRYGGGEPLEQDKEAVYYVDRAGKVTRVTEQPVKPNGIALSPDGNYLYVVDWGADALLRFEIESPGRLKSEGRTIALLCEPDGMTVDREGRLYTAGRDGVTVLGPDGRWIGVIRVPEWPANCTFGGRNWSTLFITARTGLYSIETRTRGWHVHLDGVPK